MRAKRASRAFTDMRAKRASRAFTPTAPDRLENRESLSNVPTVPNFLKANQNPPGLHGALLFTAQNVHSSGARGGTTTGYGNAITY